MNSIKRWWNAEDHVDLGVKIAVKEIRHNLVFVLIGFATITVVMFLFHL